VIGSAAAPLALLIAACSGKTESASCGGAICADAQDAASTFNDSASPIQDSSAADSPNEPTDAPLLDVSSGDSQYGDAQDDATPDAEPAPDPCPPAPPASLMVCDPACAGSSFTATSCSEAKCGPMAVLKLPSSDQFPTSVRTPNAPGVDPNCQSQCPKDGWVYGIGLQIDTTYKDPFVVKVGAPWEIIHASETPYCTDTHNYPPSPCAYVDPVGNANPIYIMTKDPNAPARNISFIIATATSCP
jgi:hypothetical protein